MKGAIQLAVLGVGHAGIHIVARLAAQWSEPPPVVAIGSDRALLSQWPEEVLPRLLIGDALTGGRSTGGDPEIGRQVAEADRARLQNLFNGYDLAVLVGGLGGGLATGALPVMARLARASGCLAIALVTLPFDFEGEYRRRRAETGLQALQEAADVVVALPNQKLFRLMGGDVRVAEAFERADVMVSHALYCLWRLMARPGLMGLDFADVRALIKGAGGIGAFGYGEGSGSGRAVQAAQRLLESPYLESGRLLHEAEAVLVSVTGGTDMTLAEVDEIGRLIRGATRAETPLLMGTSVDPAWDGKIGITVLAAERWKADSTGQLRLGLDSIGSPASVPASPPPQEREGPERSEGQRELTLAARPRGLDRFKGSEPTVENGENLDIPTFMRRNVSL